jgi:hypothetical protein
VAGREEVLVHHFKERGGASKALLWLGWFTGVAFIVIGIAGGIWPGHWDDAPASDQIVWVVLGVGGGLAILAGLHVFPRFAWAGAALVSVGAVTGALPIFWALLPLLLAAALVMLSILSARRRPATV